MTARSLAERPARVKRKDAQGADSIEPVAAVERVPGGPQDRAIDDVFRALDMNASGALSRRKIFDALRAQGIMETDDRIGAMVAALKARSDEQPIGREDFAAIARPNLALLDRVVKGALVIPRFDQFAADVEEIFEACRENRRGEVATYIPQLARVDPEQFGLAVCTVDGQRAFYGSHDAPYCVQSSCKPINYSIALELNGEDNVHKHVGREPSGRSFNELALNGNNVPHNPMINAGAIMCCSMIRPELAMSDRFDYIMSVWTGLAGGRRVGYNNAVYLSEKATADRNFALAYFMQEKRSFPPETNLLETLDFYFQCCSIETDVRRMSIIAATLANAGVCPLTEERCFSNSTVKHCLSLMYSCGMYDFSGEFAFSVGIPAKSGVSGVMMVVIPRVMGFAVWSPRLDALGNSVRGVDFCKRLVRRFAFHNYDNISGSSEKISPVLMQTTFESDKVYNLIRAASLGDVSEIARMIAYGVDLDSADYDGRTPLHLAAVEGREEAVAYLLARGVNPQPKDRWGMSPLDDAIRHGHEQIAATLRSVVGRIG